MLNKKVKKVPMIIGIKEPILEAIRRRSKQVGIPFEQYVEKIIELKVLSEKW